MATYSLFPSLSARLSREGKADPERPEDARLDAETLSDLQWNELQRLGTFFEDVPSGLKRADLEAALRGRRVPTRTLPGPGNSVAGAIDHSVEVATDGGEDVDADADVGE